MSEPGFMLKKFGHYYAMVRVGWLTRCEQQDTKSAAEFYEGKVGELAANIKDLEGIVQSKTNSLRVVEEGEFGVLDEGGSDLC